MNTLTARGQATRARIVETAARLMHVNGVAATSVDEVLAEAKAGKSQFYHYFDTKGDLVEAVLDFQAGVGDAEQAAILARTPGWEGIRAWLDAVIEAQEGAGYRGGCPVGSMAAELAERDPRLRTRLGEAFERKRMALAERLWELRRQGLLSEDADPDTLAGFVMATLQGALLLASTLKQQESLAGSVDEAWRHLLSFRR
jgi:TetR/AcrR family transcriptional regulator, transcriptional repressor for nem operon